MTRAGRIGKRALQLLAILLVMIGLWIGAVIFPTPLFAHSASFDGYRVYSDEPIPDDFERVIAETVRRVGRVRAGPSTRPMWQRSSRMPTTIS